MKYQPYRGYGCHPWLWYSLPTNTSPKRIRTRGDWLYNGTAWTAVRRWWRPSDNGGSVYEKQRAHRRFRYHAKQAIARQLSDPVADWADVSHAFRYCGDWLD